MENNLLLVGKLLGEVYRIQKHLNMPTSASKGHVYGLLKGFEPSIEQELRSIGLISEDKVDAVANVLDEYFLDDKKLASFKGFYDIEHRLLESGVDRGDALVIIKQFNADERFHRVIKKMDSSDSPSECRTFKLYDDEQ